MAKTHKVIDIQRSMIDAYVQDQASSEPLFFRKPTGKKLILPEKAKNISTMIITVLNMSLEHVSVREDGFLETTQNRLRSAFDIWRHLKAILPTLSLWRVMEALYYIVNNNDDTIRGQYCSMVKRRVFKTSGQNLGTIHDEYEEDEFGLKLKDWELLHY